MENNINLELLKKVRLKLEDLNREKEFQIQKVEDKFANKIQVLEDYIENQESLIDSTFDDSLTEDIVPLGNNLFRKKAIKKKVDTTKFIENVKIGLDTILGEKEASKLMDEVMEVAETTKVSVNRTNFVKELKAKAKIIALDSSGIISAAEDKSSEKTIDFQTVSGK
ncbi:MAG: hypothetical protein ACK5MZ_00010 [Aestuariibaculum sp.]